MTGRQRKSAWISANWPRVVGIPRPEDGEWMLRDTPLSLATLCDLKSRNLVKTLRKKHVMGSATARETVQKRYRTKSHDGPFEWFETRTSLPRTVFEGLAARPEADLYVVAVVFDDVAVAAPIEDCVDRVEDELGLDVQTVTLDATDTDPDPAEYPGRVIPVDLDDLTDTSSDLARALPTSDIMSVQVGPAHADAAAELIETAEPEYRLINSDAATFVGCAREFLLNDGGEVAVGPRPPRDRPEHPAQKTFAHFDPTVIVDDEVRLEPVDDGQTTFDALTDSVPG